jgi:hypothetical protein
MHTPPVVIGSESIQLPMKIEIVPEEGLVEILGRAKNAPPVAPNPGNRVGLTEEILHASERPLTGPRAFDIYGKMG